MPAARFEALLRGLLREVRWAGEDRNVGSAFHDYAKRCGGVRETGAFLAGDGRRGLSVTTGRGKFLVTVEPYPPAGARGRRA
jgi:hypothetical protein